MCKKILVLSSTVALMVAFSVSNQTPEQDSLAEKVERYIEGENGDLDPERLTVIAQTVLREAERYGVDYRLILAVMKVESNFRESAVSSRGARGLLQVKPSLARYIARDAGVDWRGPKTLDEPDKNVRIGVHFLSSLIEDFDSLHHALIAYNMGPTRLRQILSQQSRPRGRFSKAVLREYDSICAVLPEP